MPQFLGAVGDEMAHIAQLQPAPVRYADATADLLNHTQRKVQTTVGVRLIAQQLAEGAVPARGQQAAAEAIHARQAAPQRQIRRQDLLPLERHEVPAGGQWRQPKGRVAGLLRLLVRRLKQQLADRQKAFRRRQAFVPGAQLAFGGALFAPGVGRHQVVEGQDAARQVQFGGQRDKEQRADARGTQARQGAQQKQQGKQRQGPGQPGAGRGRGRAENRCGIVDDEGAGEHQGHQDERDGGGLSGARSPYAAKQGLQGDAAQHGAADGEEQGPARRHAKEVEAGQAGQDGPKGVELAESQQQTDQRQHDPQRSLAAQPRTTRQEGRQQRQPQTDDAAVSHELAEEQAVMIGQQRARGHQRIEGKSQNLFGREAAAALRLPAELKRRQQLGRGQQQRHGQHGQQWQQGARHASQSVGRRRCAGLQRGRQRQAGRADEGRLGVPAEELQRQARRQQQQAGTHPLQRAQQPQQQPGQPGDALQLVNLLDVRADEAAQAEEQRSGQRRQGVETATRQAESAPQGEENVQQGAEADAVGRVQRQQGPVERVERARLGVGQQGHAHEDLGRPQGQLAGHESRVARRPPGIKIIEGVAAPQDEAAEGQWRQMQERQRQQQQRDARGAQLRGVAHRRSGLR